GGTAPEEQASHNEELLWLTEGLATLPEDQREVVQLGHLHGLSLGEIEGQTGPTRGAVGGWRRCATEGYEGCDPPREQRRCRTTKTARSNSTTRWRSGAGR